VEVDPEALFVRDGHVFTSAGIAAGIDVALALVEDDVGADVARTAAKVLVVFLQRPGGQSQFSTWTMSPPVRSEPLRAVIEAVVLDPAADHSLEAMARRAHFSVRHLSRLFEEQLGVGGAHYVERVRVEAARALLEGSDEGVAAVAKRTGFRSEETMRRAFVRELGVSPGAYRSTFRTTGVHRVAGSAADSWWPSVVHRVPVSAAPG